MKKSNKILIAVAVFIIAMCAAFGIYVSDYYKADAEAVASLSNGNVVVTEEKEGVKVFTPPYKTDTAVVFYPGGKVEDEAYVPLMKALASKGIMCVLYEMPFNLAVFGINSAKDIREQYPEIKNWYMSGHSLGGSMAASFAAENKDSFEGVILLASYSTSDISDMRVLSLYGSEDGILSRDKYEEYKINLPSDYEEYVIEGGNHAYFGAYGFQENDGKASIENKEQIVFAAEKISQFVK